MTIRTSFKGYSISSIRSFLSTTVNALFNEFITSHYLNSCLIGTYRWIRFENLPWLFFLIPSLFFKFSNNVTLPSSSFTTECHVMYEVHLTIKSFNIRNFVICLDSQSCFIAFNYSHLISTVSYLVLQIGFILLSNLVKCLNKCI